MMKNDLNWSYTLQDPQQLDLFQQDCMAAVGQCPNVGPRYAQCYKSDKGLSHAFASWFFTDLLWKKGYSDYLTQKARNTFFRYAVFLDYRVYDSKENVILDK